MPNPSFAVLLEKHLKQAYINEELAKHLRHSCSRSLYSPWYHVALFYSALHYFAAFLANRDQSIPDFHKGTNGSLELARSEFKHHSPKTGKAKHGGTDYSYLFQNRHNACYTPLATLFPRDPAVAFDALERIKTITFMETKMRFKMKNQGYVKIAISDSEVENMLNR